MNTYYNIAFLLSEQKPNQLYKWMAGMLRKGYPLPAILERLADIFPEDKYFLQKAACYVHEGCLLSEALQIYGGGVHPMIKTLISVGEKHDILPQTLTLACELNDSHYEQVQETDFIKFKSYYMCIALALPFLLMMQIIFVFPVFKDYYFEAGGQMPRLTLHVIDFAGWIKHNFLYFLPVAYILAVAVKSYPFWLYRWEFVYRLLEKLPLAGRIFRYSRWWKMFYGIGSLLQSGIPPEEAVTAIGKGLQMPSVTEAAHRIAAHFDNDADPSDMLMNEKMFPRGLRWAISTARQGGDIPGTLLKAGIMYRDLEGALLARFITISFILSTIIIAAIVGIVVISLYLPIFSRGMPLIQ